VTINLALCAIPFYSRDMHSLRRSVWVGNLLALLILTTPSAAVAKPHVITFGKWTPVQWFPGTEENKPVVLKVRALFVDGRIKEYIVGPPHEVTDRLFAVRRAFRVNDSLPEDSGAIKWQWQRGGWLLIDRVTGRISSINLPEFDAFYSAASWYRDYVAYCGVSDDGTKVFAMVAQLSRRKPVLKKSLASEGVSEDAAPDSACLAPAWERAPVRVSFDSTGSAKQTFAVRGHVVDLMNDTEEDEEASK
jgi:hypothetical protein